MAKRRIDSVTSDIYNNNQNDYRVVLYSIKQRSAKLMRLNLFSVLTLPTVSAILAKLKYTGHNWTDPKGSRTEALLSGDHLLKRLIKLVSRLLSSN